MESSPNNFIQEVDAYIPRPNGKRIKLYAGVGSLFESGGAGGLKV